MPLTKANIICKAKAASDFSCFILPACNVIKRWKHHIQLQLLFITVLSTEQRSIAYNNKRFSQNWFSHSDLLLLMCHGKISWAFFLQFPFLPVCWSTLFVPNELLIISFAILCPAIFQVTATPSKNVPGLNILYELLDTTSKSPCCSLCSCLPGNKFTGQTGLSLYLQLLPSSYNTIQYLVKQWVSGILFPAF